jgi:hypothetical protein
MSNQPESPQAHNPFRNAAADPLWAFVAFWLGSLLLGVGASAYNAFWGSPEPYLRGWFGLGGHVFVVSIILGLPAPGFLIAVNLSRKIAKEHSGRLYVLSSCSGILYGGCLLACFLIFLLATECSGVFAALLGAVWLLFPFLAGRIGLWVACRCGVLRPHDNMFR